MKSLLCCLGLLLFTAASPPSPNPAVGRFQLVPAVVKLGGFVGGQSSQMDTSELFKIDTATGDTWILVRLNVNGKSVEGWHPLGPLDTRAIKDIR